MLIFHFYHLEIEDTYHTVALKLLSAFKWLREFSKSSELQWILKLDDDVLINFERLVKFVNQIRLNQNSIYCLVYERAAPFRGYSKWYSSPLPNVIWIFFETSR